MTENITMETFHGITVRCVNQDGREMMPVIDVANAVKMDRGNLSKHLKRFKKYYQRYQGVVEITTPGGSQKLTCLTRDGILGLLFKVNPSDSKDPEIVDRILEFQHWATEILKQHTVGQPVVEDPYAISSSALMPAPDIYRNAVEMVKEQLDIADLAIERCDIPKAIAHGYAWTLAGERTGLELNAYADYIKKMKPVNLQLPESSSMRSPVPVPQDQIDFESHYSLGKLAEYLKQSENSVRIDLEKLGVLALVNSRWQITRYGEQFAKLFWLTPMSPYDLTPRPHIRYNPKAKELLIESYRTEPCHLK